MRYSKLLFFTLCGCMVSGSIIAQMTIQVISAPQLTPLLDDIFIAGTFNEWASGDENYKLNHSGNTWSININATEGAEIAFKMTRGSWATVEGNALGAFLADRTTTYHNGQTLQITIEGWEDIAGNHTVTPNVRILDGDFFMPQLNRYRRVWISFPPGYFTNDTHYPVVYMHDGQNVFDAATSFAGEWQVDETLAGSTVQECAQTIIVGIDNGGALRIDELSPWLNTGYNEGGEGDEYLDFIVETLKPFMDENFRTLPSREHTAIAGSSLGGLISMYALSKHNNVFSKAGIFSPAFWFNTEIYEYVEAHPLSNDTKVYFVCGTNESSSMVSDMQQMYTAVLSSGVPTSNVGYLVVNGGQHNENFWANQFPTAYNFLMTCASSDIPTDEGATNEVRLFPNPVKDTFEVIISSGQLKRITVFNSKGKAVLLQDGQNGKIINVGKLSAGTYQVKVEYLSTSGLSQSKVISLLKQ